MARQNRTKQAEAPAEAATNEETPVTENTDTQTESTETPVDLTAFKAAVASNLGEADASTGEVPEAAKAAVNAEYVKLDGQKAKGEARKYLDEQMLEAVGQLDAVKARSYSDFKGGLKAGGGTSTPKAPADPALAYVQKMASLRLAFLVVEPPEIEGDRDLGKEIDELVNSLGEQVQAQRAYLADESEDKGDGPELSPVVRAAFKLASGKASGGGTRRASSGVRRDIAKHIQSAFSDVEPGGFLSVADIAKHRSEEYGDDEPSQGAISARLFPSSGKFTVEGVEPVDKGDIDGKNPKGARKVA